VLNLSVGKEEEAPNYATKSDIQWIERSLERARQDREKIKKMIRVIVAILVDKKLIGEQIAKTFMESTQTEPDPEKLIAWLLKKLEE